MDAAASAAYYAATTVAALASPSSPAPSPPPGLARAALAAAGAFTLVDRLLSLLPTAAWLAAHARTPPPGPKAADRLAREVTIKLVGCVHLAIQLPLAVVALAGASGRAAFGGVPLLPSSTPGPASAAARLYASTPLTHAAVAISAGYFAWDVASLLPRVSVAGPAMLAHGCLCAALYWYGALSGHLSWFGSLFVLWEASTPAVYARWLALETGWGPGTRPYAVAGGAMIGSFFIARVLAGAAASAAFWTSAAAELASRPPPRPGAALPVSILNGFRFANVAMTALNLYWFGRMVAGLVRLLRRSASVVEVGGGGGGEKVRKSPAPSPARPAGKGRVSPPRRASEE